MGRPSPSDARVLRIAKDGPLLLGPANHVTVAAVPPALLETWDRRPGTRAVASVLVRGVRAAVDWSEADRLVTLRWRDGDRAYVVVGHGSDGADLRDVQPWWSRWPGACGGRASRPHPSRPGPHMTRAVPPGRT